MLKIANMRLAVTVVAHTPAVVAEIFMPHPQEDNSLCCRMAHVDALAGSDSVMTRRLRSTSHASAATTNCLLSAECRLPEPINLTANTTTTPLGHWPGPTL